MAGFVLLLLVVLIAYACCYVYGASGNYQGILSRIWVTLAAILASCITVVMWFLIVCLLCLVVEHETAGLVSASMASFIIFVILAVVLAFTYREIIRIGYEHVDNTTAFSMAFISPFVVLGTIIFIALAPLDIADEECTVSESNVCEISPQEGR